MERIVSSFIKVGAVILLVLTLSVVPCFARLSMLGSGNPPESLPDLGVRKGAFMFYPRLGAGVEYNDNIYAVKNNTESDWIMMLAPRITVDSTWANHELKFDTGVENGFYMDNSDEDYLDAHAMVGGRLDIVRGSYFEAKGGYESIYEDRTSPDSLTAWEDPARFERLTGSGMLHHGFNRFFVEIKGDAFGYSYKDVDLIGGGTDTQEDRDRMEYTTGLRLGYEWLPHVNPFIQYDYNWVRYDEEDLARRDSDGYRVGVGTKIYLGGVTSGEIWGGYLNQEYDYDNQEDISGPWYGLSLTWNATQLTSLTAQVEKRVKETTQLGASGINGTDVKLAVIHELRRNLVVGLDLSYIYDDYEGVSITDDYYKIMPRISYALNRNLSADFRYEYTTRKSSRYEDQREYAVNRFMLSISGGF